MSDRVLAITAEQRITQYWTRPRAPKEKPYVGRFIGTLQKECLDYHYEPMNAAETTDVVNDWPDKYHPPMKRLVSCSRLSIVPQWVYPFLIVVCPIGPDNEQYR